MPADPVIKPSISSILQFFNEFLLPHRAAHEVESSVRDPCVITGSPTMSGKAHQHHKPNVTHRDVAQADGKIIKSLKALT
jgi:hypothetical protein